MNVKTLILGIVTGGMISLGTYFFLPPPNKAHANDCATNKELWAVAKNIKDATEEEVWSAAKHLINHIESVEKRRVN